MTDHPDTLAQQAQMIEVFRKALVVEHGADWTFEVISKAAHVCARAAITAKPWWETRGPLTDEERKEMATWPSQNPEPPDVSDTPEPPLEGCKACGEKWFHAEGCMEPNDPPIPDEVAEGGQPDTDDERCPGGDACRCNEVEPEGGWPVSLLDEDELRDRVRRLERELAEAERPVMQLIAERDTNEDWANRLAAIIAPPGVLGEHSSANNPWQNALDYAAEARSHGEVLFRARVADAGGGVVYLQVDRDTEEYPEEGQRVVVRATADQLSPAVDSLTGGDDDAN